MLIDHSIIYRLTSYQVTQDISTIKSKESFIILIKQNVKS